MDKIDNEFNKFKQNVNTIVMSEINKCKSNVNQHNDEYINEIVNNIIVNVNAGFKITPDKTLVGVPTKYSDSPLTLTGDKNSSMTLLDTPPTTDVDNINSNLPKPSAADGIQEICTANCDNPLLKSPGTLADLDDVYKDKTCEEIGKVDLNFCRSGNSTKCAIDMISGTCINKDKVTTNPPASDKDDSPIIIPPGMRTDFNDVYKDKTCEEIGKVDLNFCRSGNSTKCIYDMNEFKCVNKANNSQTTDILDNNVESTPQNNQPSSNGTNQIEKTVPNLGPPKFGGERCKRPDGKTDGIDNCVRHINNLRTKYMKNPTKIGLKEDQQQCTQKESVVNADKPHSAFTWCNESAQGGSTGQSCMCAIGGFLNECIGKTAEECVKASNHGSPLLDPRLKQISYGADGKNDITVNYYYK